MLLLDYDIINFVYGSPLQAIKSLLLNRETLRKRIDNATDPVNLHAAKGSLKLNKLTVDQLRKDIANDTANNDKFNSIQY